MDASPWKRMGRSQPRTLLSLFLLGGWKHPHRWCFSAVAICSLLGSLIGMDTLLHPGQSGTLAAPLLISAGVLLVPGVMMIPFAL